MRQPLLGTFGFEGGGGLQRCLFVCVCSCQMVAGPSKHGKKEWTRRIEMEMEMGNGNGYGKV